MEQTELMNEHQTILEAVFDHDLPELKLIKEYNVAMDNNDEKAFRTSVPRNYRDECLGY